MMESRGALAACILTVILLSGAFLPLIAEAEEVPEEKSTEDDFDFEIKEVPITSYTGTVHHVGGSGPGNYSSIQLGVDACSDGDIVHIHGGTYNERVTVSSEIWIQGNGSRINPPISIDPVAFTLDANNVTITNILISYFTRGIYSNGYGHNITGNVFHDNLQDIRISCQNSDIHSSWTSDGIVIQNNRFERLDPGTGISIYLGLSFDQENSTNSKTGDILIRENEFTSTSTSGTFIDASINIGGTAGGTLNVGDLIIYENNMTGAALGFGSFSFVGNLVDTITTVGRFVFSKNILRDFTYSGISFDYYDISSLSGSTTVTLGDVHLSDNRMYSSHDASGIHISDYALWDQVDDNSIFTSGNLSLSNNTIDVSGDAIYLDYALLGGNIFGNGRVTTRESLIYNNHILNSTKGINVYLGSVINMGDDSHCILEELMIRGNTINSTNVPISINMFSLGNQMSDNSTFEMEGLAISENYMKGSAFGVFMSMQNSGNNLKGKSLVDLGYINITGNMIKAYMGVNFDIISNLGKFTSDSSRFVFRGINITGNEIDAETEGIFFDEIENIGTNCQGDSSVDIGSIIIRDNDIWSQAQGIYVYNLNNMGDTLTDNASFTFAGIDISSNTIWSSGIGIYFYYIYFLGANLKKNSTVRIHSIEVHKNEIYSLNTGIEIYRAFNNGVNIQDDASWIMKDIDLSENTVFSDSHGIYVRSLETFGYNLNHRSSSEFGSLMISENRVNSQSNGIHIDEILEFGYRMFDNSSFEMKDIIFTRNSISSVGVGIYLGEYSGFGNYLNEWTSFEMGSLKVTFNEIMSDDGGIVTDQINALGLHMTGRSTFIMEDINFDSNRIISVGNGINPRSTGTLGSHMSDNSLFKMGWITSSDNMIKTNGTGILFNDISQIGFRMQRSSTAQMYGINLINNTVEALDSGVVIDTVESIGSEMSGDSIIKTGNISLSLNMIDAGDRGAGIDSILTTFSYMADNSRANIGKIILGQNEITADGEGLFINNIDEMGLYSEGTAKGNLDKIMIVDNDIRSNGTCIESTGHQGSGKMMKDSAEISIGNMNISGNNLYSANSAIRIHHSSLADQMISGELQIGDLDIENNIIDTGTGIGITYETSIMTDFSNLTVGDLNIIDNDLIRTSDSDMIMILLKTDTRDNSTARFGGTLVEGNDRISSNISGIHIQHDFIEGGVGRTIIDPTMIISNNITDSATGIEFESVDQASIYLNNFISNSVHLELGSTTVSWISPEPVWYRHGMKNYSSELGNFWDTYTGPDQDNNGIGDSPYNTGFGNDDKPLTTGTWNYFPPWNDFNPPEITITFPLNGSILNDVNLTLTWNATDDLLGIETQWVRLDEGPWINVGLVFSHDISYLTEGAHLIRIRAADMAGNINETEVEITVDISNPFIEILSPDSGSAFNETTVEVTWSGSDLISGIAGYAVALGNGTFTDVGMADSRVFTDLPQGMHHIHVRATDNAGNRITSYTTIYIDLTEPIIRFIHPKMNMLITRDRVNATWTGNGGLTSMSSYRISIDGGNITDVGTLTSRVFRDLTPGQHRLKLTGYDAAGNHNTTEVLFTVDITIPGVEILTPENGAYINTTSVKARWIVNGLIHPLDRIEFRLDRGEWTPVTGDNTTFTDLQEGAYTFEVRATDRKGNTAVSRSEFTVDITLPSISSMSHEGNSAIAKGPVIIEFSETLGNVNVTMNGVSVDHQLEGTELTLTDNLSSGTAYEIEISAADLAGNTLNTMLTFTTSSRGTVSGRIVDQDGRPVSGGKIVFDSGEEIDIGDNGIFSGEVEAGLRTATVYDKDGNEMGTFDVDVIGGDTVPMGDIDVEPEDKEEGSSWWILIVIIVAVVLVLIAVIAFILISKGKETEEEEYDEEEWEDEDFQDDEFDDDEFEDEELFEDEEWEEF